MVPFRLHELKPYFNIEHTARIDQQTGHQAKKNICDMKVFLQADSLLCNMSPTIFFPGSYWVLTLLSQGWQQLLLFMFWFAYHGLVHAQGLFYRSRHWNSKGVDERVVTNHQCLQLCGITGTPSMRAKGHKETQSSFPIIHKVDNIDI